MNGMRKPLIKLLFVLLLVLLTASCNANDVTPAAEPSTPSAEEPLPAATDIPASPTLTPEASRVILVTGETPDPRLLDLTTTALQTLADESGLGLLTQTTLLSEDITSGVRVVVVLKDAVAISAAAAGAPNVQFVGIRTSGAAAESNVSILGDAITDQERLSFMAGYLSALISTDYKMAALVSSGTEDGAVAADAYMIGARFYCGLCQPKYPPYGTFPKWESLAVGSDPGAWQPLIDTLVNSGVEILYLQAPVLSPELLTYLADLGIKVVSDGSPDMLQAQWVATLTLDPSASLAAVWPDLMSGVGGHQMPLSVDLVDLENGWVSEGRYRLFEEMVADLEAGLVSPNSVP